MLVLNARPYHSYSYLVVFRSSHLISLVVLLKSDHGNLSAVVHFLHSSGLFASYGESGRTVIY